MLETSVTNQSRRKNRRNTTSDFEANEMFLQKRESKPPISLQIDLNYLEWLQIQERDYKCIQCKCGIWDKVTATSKVSVTDWRVAET